MNIIIEVPFIPLDPLQFQETTCRILELHVYSAIVSEPRMRYSVIPSHTVTPPPVGD